MSRTAVHTFDNQCLDQIGESMTTIVLGDICPTGAHSEHNKEQNTGQQTTRYLVSSSYECMIEKAETVN